MHFHSKNKTLRSKMAEMYTFSSALQTVLRKKGVTNEIGSFLVQDERVRRVAFMQMPLSRMLIDTEKRWGGRQPPFPSPFSTNACCCGLCDFLGYQLVTPRLEHSSKNFIEYNFSTPVLFYLLRQNGLKEFMRDRRGEGVEVECRTVSFLHIYFLSRLKKYLPSVA